MKNSVDHIFWFAHYNLIGPSTRYRAKYPLEHLRRTKGISYDLVWPDRSLGGLLRFLRSWLGAFFRRKNTKVVVQKVCTNRWYAKSLKILVRARPNDCIFELDDAEQYRNPVETLHFFLENCSAVSVGSNAIREYSLQFNDRVVLNTSPVLPHDFRKKTRNKKFTLGWVGDFGNGREMTRSFSHKTSLYSLVFPVIKTLDFPVRLVLLGVKNPEDFPELRDYFADAPNVELVIPEGLDWRDDLWVYPEICKFDLGLSPMVDHPFTQAKSAFKAKQYLSCGVPVLASDIGENRLFVAHDQNGLLCANPEAFKSGIETFFRMERTVYQGFCDKAYESRKMFGLDEFSSGLLNCF